MLELIGIVFAILIGLGLIWWGCLFLYVSLIFDRIIHNPFLVYLISFILVLSGSSLIYLGIRFYQRVSIVIS